MDYKTPIDEAQLVKDLQDVQRSQGAFRILVDAYSEPLYWQIRRMVLNHDDANDLLQASFMKVWQNIHHFRGEAKLSTWLYKIAVNESINFLKKERQRNNVSSEEDLYLLNSLESDPYFDGDELQKKLEKAILALPEKQAAGIQHAILRRDEIRGDVGDSRHLGRGTESLVPSCAQKSHGGDRSRRLLIGHITRKRPVSQPVAFKCLS